MQFRKLTAEEIDCRISTCNQWGVGLLLYKDARCDMNILDEAVGPMNWKRHHTRDNANCIVAIWDKDKEQWIEKEDTGTESFTEKEKGLASDSFKRACFNWGIGRELYTAPNMFVGKKDLEKHEKEDFNGREKWVCKDSFKVEEIQYEGDKIVYVKVLNQKKNVYIEFGTPAEVKKEQDKISSSVITEVKLKALLSRCEKEGVSTDRIKELYKVDSLADLTESKYANINQFWDRIKGE